ncbi:uncharacterized protein EV420DRAFT_1566852 [Desarmillaria tabescens]|uniref:Clp R domain-containing protein n=1 Tax=Armillaria tabescens TaxID=1929756 RepID=A0AA39JTE5_ARMTA|nr:uncharacterized protein EV420DRAFT_1566852 [Desarmillaria tabescens]KAK0448454.1 hypothetical protein EV420DRAFT_1566852 [Desarmillaria tabescens]
MCKQPQSVTIEHLLLALIARGLSSRPFTFSTMYMGAQLSSRYSCFLTHPPTPFSVWCYRIQDSPLSGFTKHSDLIGFVSKSRHPHSA